MPDYCGHERVLSRTGNVAAAIVAALQRDLRGLGYYTGDYTGVWGAGLDAAIRAVRYDLTHAGAIAAYNAKRSVVATPADGASSLEPALADAVAAMAGDVAFPKLPVSGDPVADNKRALATVAAMRTLVAPAPFMLAIFAQESGGRHFQVSPLPGGDRSVTVGLDRNDGASTDHITSRGYGIGQHTLFHHPPTVADVRDVIFDPAGSARAAFATLRDKFDHAVVSTQPSLRADDRSAEWPISPLRLCRYAASDSRFMSDCVACAQSAGQVAIAPGRPTYPGATLLWAATPYYVSATYPHAPDRTGFRCDWPYAVRRYNGAGINSFHYQVRVLTNLARPG